MNNVETLSTVPHIIAMGGAEYAELGVNTLDRHAHLLGLGSREAARQLRGRARHARSATSSTDSRAASATDTQLKFFLPGGASFQWLTGSDEHLDAPLDMDYVQQTSATMLGSGAVMVFDDDHRTRCSSRGGSRSSTRTRSCGKCTPCREGTGWIEKVLYRMSHGLGRPDDLDLLFDVGDEHLARRAERAVHADHDLPARPVVVSPIASLDKYFRDEVEAMCSQRPRVESHA